MTPITSEAWNKKTRLSNAFSLVDDSWNFSYTIFSFERLLGVRVVDDEDEGVGEEANGVISIWSLVFGGQNFFFA